MSAVIHFPVSTKQRGWLWRFWNRNRAWCLTPNPPVDPRTLELKRRGDRVLEQQMDLRVLAKWKRRHIVDNNGHVKRALLLPLPNNVIPFTRRA